MLVSENFGGGQQRRLPPGLGDREHCPQRDERLARSHLALHEAVHGNIRGQILADLVPDRSLVTRELEG